MGEIISDKIALAPCNGMSPNGLISCVAVGDLKKENGNIISICMGSTSADIEGRNNEMLKKYPIVAVNGCSNSCVNKILKNKGIDVRTTLQVSEILDDFNVSAKDARITGTGNNVGGIVGSNLYSSTSVSESKNTYYSISGAYAKDLTITGVNNVGGVSGEETGYVYGAVADNCDVTATGENSGGLIGYYTGYKGTVGSYISSTKFYLIHSYANECTVNAVRYAGGLVGNFVFGTISYCFVGNTSVNASRGSGGFIGCFDNSKLNDLQYKAYIRYNYVANVESGKVVSGNESVGGFIGTAMANLNFYEDREDYGNIENNLICISR